MPDPMAQVVFPFEELDAAFEAPPLSARRALDVAGFRLAPEAYRSLSREDRLALAVHGFEDRVDVAAIDRLVRRASPAATRARPAPEPDPSAPPEQLLGVLGGRRTVSRFDWMSLRPVERYALVQVMRRAIAHDDVGLLELALASVLPAEEPDAASDRGSSPPRAASSPPPSGARGARWASDARAQAVAAEAPAYATHRTSQLPAAYAELLRGTASASAPPRSTPPPEAPPPRRESAPPARGESAPPPLSTHLGPSGEVRMVDVGDKPTTARRATASGVVRMRPETAQRLARGDAPKGEVLATARVAGILAAKRTPELVPLCHHVALAKVEVHVDVEPSSGLVTVTSVAEAVDRTGVEMEALVATSIACLTIYDMLKGIDRDMVVSEVKLLSKAGGQRGPYERAPDQR